MRYVVGGFLTILGAGLLGVVAHVYVTYQTLDARLLWVGAGVLAAGLSIDWGKEIAQGTKPIVDVALAAWRGRKDA